VGGVEEGCLDALSPPMSTSVARQTDRQAGGSCTSHHPIPPLTHNTHSQPPNHPLVTPAHPQSHTR